MWDGVYDSVGYEASTDSEPNMLDERPAARLRGQIRTGVDRSTESAKRRANWTIRVGRTALKPLQSVALQLQISGLGRRKIGGNRVLLLLKSR